MKTDAIRFRLNGSDIAATPANQHQHVVGTGIFWCQAADLDRFPLAEWRDYFGGHAPSRERKLDFVLQVVVPARACSSGPYASTITSLWIRCSRMRFLRSLGT